MYNKIIDFTPNINTESWIKHFRSKLEIARTFIISIDSLNTNEVLNMLDNLMTILPESLKKSNHSELTRSFIVSIYDIIKATIADLELFHLDNVEKYFKAADICMAINLDEDYEFREPIIKDNEQFDKRTEIDNVRSGMPLAIAYLDENKYIEAMGIIISRIDILLDYKSSNLYKHMPKTLIIQAERFMWGAIRSIKGDKIENAYKLIEAADAMLATYETKFEFGIFFKEHKIQKRSDKILI